MKPFVIASIVIILAACPALAVTHTINNSGNTFSPSTLTIALGDTVNFAIASIHTVVEVSEANWNINSDIQLPGGFSRGSGGGIVVITSTGTHWYVCGNHNNLGMKGTITVNPTTDVGSNTDPMPARFSLAQNYPNPFNPSTEIGFSVARTSHTEIAVYDALGRLMKTLVDETLPAGSHTTAWDGTDGKGEAAGTGAYFIVMSAGENGRDYFGTSRILLIR